MPHDISARTIGNEQQRQRAAVLSKTERADSPARVFSGLSNSRRTS
jgi:hypothetical protein